QIFLIVTALGPGFVFQSAHGCRSTIPQPVFWATLAFSAGAGFAATWLAASIAFLFSAIYWLRVRTKVASIVAVVAFWMLGALDLQLRDTVTAVPDAFGYPKRQVHARLQAAGVATFRTDMEGAVTFWIDKSGVCSRLPNRR